MNNNHPHHPKKERYSSSSSSNDYHQENKSTKTERTSKPLAMVNGQPTRASKSTFSPPDHHYFYDENQFHPTQTMKRKYDSSISYQQPKRFHTEQTLPIYPTSHPLSSEPFYYDHPPPPMQQRPLPPPRYMLLKNDPALSDTIPPVRMSANSHEPLKMIEHENICSDDIEHLLDIFKNEVEMIGFDPIATTSTDDCPLNINHCLSTNDFCSY